MPKFTKKADTTTITIAGQPITVSPEDADRITAQSWNMVETNDRGPTFATVLLHSHMNGPVVRLLGNFILNAGPNTYIEQIDRTDPWNYARQNLRAYAPPVPTRT
jgi:hypothetical protein